MSSMEQADRGLAGSEEADWIEVQNSVPLAEDEVQIWRTSATGAGPFYSACHALLSPDELERLGRLRTGMARDEFVTARGCLRVLLGTALGQDPKAIVLSAGKHGKPFLAGVEFNVSHSKGMILLALSRKTAIGIDVEWMDARIEAMEIARDTFAPEEVEYIALTVGDERVQAFYRCWVRKEAVTKAHGQGITLSLNDFKVDLAAQHESSVIVRAEQGGDAQVFYVRGLPLYGSFAGALATTAPGCPVRLFELSAMMIIGQ